LIGITVLTYVVQIATSFPPGASTVEISNEMVGFPAVRDRSGWDKRQAILVLYIFADGIPRIRPKLIFHGKATDEGGKIEECESHLYHKGVTVHFNSTAYNNEELTI
jgi:hypothetical protein